MNHKRKKPKFQRAGCWCMHKSDKNSRTTLRSTLRKLHPVEILGHGKLRRPMDLEFWFEGGEI